MALKLVSVDDSDYLLPDPVRAAYLADVQNRITTAVSNLPGVAQAVADKVAPLTTDGQVTPLLNSATAFRQKLDGRYIFTAPPPSGDTTGATDQAVLQPLLDQAQSTRGTLYLQSGTYYVTGLATAQSFSQPRIIGTGRDYCSIIGVTNAHPTLRFKGGSGQLSGGGVDDVTIASTGVAGSGTALQIADAGGLNCHRLRIRDCGTGVQFLNEATGGFTEFDVIHDSYFAGTCRNAVAYQRTNGNESFHGSGILGCVIDNNGSTIPMIYVGPGCLPYQAPLTFTGFARSTGGIIHSDATDARPPLFHGVVSIEAFTANTLLADGGRVLLDGHIQAFGSTGFKTGSLVEIEKSYYNDAGIHIRRKPWVAGGPQQYGIGNAPSLIAGLEYGIGHLVDVYLQGPNYIRRYLLYVTQNRYSASGNVTVLADQAINNDAGAGPITSWTITDGNLYAAGAGFPNNAASQIYAFTKVTPTGELNLIF